MGNGRVSSKGAGVRKYYRERAVMNQHFEAEKGELIDLTELKSFEDRFNAIDDTLAGKLGDKELNERYFMMKKAIFYGAPKDLRSDVSDALSHIEDILKKNPRDIGEVMNFLRLPRVDRLREKMESNEAVQDVKDMLTNSINTGSNYFQFIVSMNYNGGWNRFLKENNSTFMPMKALSALATLSRSDTKPKDSDVSLFKRLGREVAKAGDKWDRAKLMRLNSTLLNWRKNK